jgi:hypothetical protein
LTIGYRLPQAAGQQFWIEKLKNFEEQIFMCLIFCYTPTTTIKLMLIQFLDGVLQLTFVSGKKENGSKFSNTL